MPSIARRRFLGWLARLAPAVALTRRLGAAAPWTPRTPRDVLLRALGAAVLPTELGDAGVERVVAGFERWAREYRAGAELLHGYGTPNIRQLGPSPAARWWAQLDALDAAAVRGHRRPFPALTVEERRALVRARITPRQGDALPSPVAADDVAIALLAHFYASPTAVDLCYGAAIGRNACRPLAASPRRPLPLRREG